MWAIAETRRRLLRYPKGRRSQAERLLVSRYRQKVFLGDLYRGHSVFLLCAGPSLAEMDLEPLRQRGIMTMAVNNVAAIFRPHLWCCGDDPGNFCDAIWYDPGILKFVPIDSFDCKLTVRDDHDRLIDDEATVADMPGVFGFQHNEEFVAERWLYEPTFNWGNDATITDAYGEVGSRSVMLLALRLLFYLGFRRVYLLGCDFRMRNGVRNYAFEQDRSPGSVDGNNTTYRVLNVRLGALLPYFQKESFEVYNCTPLSRLTVFPHKAYQAAVREATSIIPDRILTKGMYDRRERMKTA